MNASCSRLNHRLHQFEGVQISAEARLGIGNHRCEPLNPVATFCMMDLVRPDQGLIDAPHQIGHAVGWIQALIGIHLSRVVGICSHLPSTDINC